jgi:hypothetical protein
MGKVRYARVWGVKFAGRLLVTAPESISQAEIAGKVQTCVGEAVGNTPELALVVNARPGLFEAVADDHPALEGHKYSLGERARLLFGQPKIRHWEVIFQGGTPIMTLPGIRLKAIVKAYEKSIRDSLGGNEKTEIRIEAKDCGVQKIKPQDSSEVSAAPMELVR